MRIKAAFFSQPLSKIFLQTLLSLNGTEPFYAAILSISSGMIGQLPGQRTGLFQIGRKQRYLLRIMLQSKGYPFTVFVEKEAVHVPVIGSSRDAHGLRQEPVIQFQRKGSVLVLQIK